MEGEHSTVPYNANQPVIDQLEQELQSLSQETTPTVYSFVETELYKLRGGICEMMDLVSGRRVKIRAKVQIPQPSGNLNYVGRLLGPRGETLKALQANTMTKMAILGHGSMRDEQKEQELLTSGDHKYQHLKQELHLQIDSLADPSEAYYRMSHAIAEVKKTLSEIAGQHGGGMPPAWGQPNPGFGSPQGRGGFAGRGRGGGPPPGGDMGQYGGPGYDLNASNGSFGSGYGSDSAGKMPSRGRGRGMGTRPYTRGRGGRP
jgi:hypothetical protein